MLLESKGNARQLAHTAYWDIIVVACSIVFPLFWNMGQISNLYELKI